MLVSFSLEIPSCGFQKLPTKGWVHAQKIGNKSSKTTQKLAQNLAQNTLGVNGYRPRLERNRSHFELYVNELHQVWTSTLAKWFTWHKNLCQKSNFEFQTCTFTPSCKKQNFCNTVKPSQLISQAPKPSELVPWTVIRHPKHNHEGKTSKLNDGQMVTKQLSA